MLVRRVAAALLVLSSCGGETSTAGRVHVVSGLIVYNGVAPTAVLKLRIDAAAERTTFTWRAGAVPDHAMCRRALGWRLDVLGGPTEIAPNEPREIELRATSGDRIACDPVEAVARCGEPVTLVVMTDDDDVLATLDTTYHCLFPVSPVR